MRTKPRTVTELSHAVAKMLTLPPNEKKNRFDSMALCEEIMDRHDVTRDNLMRETLRSWVGEVQAKFQGGAGLGGTKKKFGATFKHHDLVPDIDHVLSGYIECALWSSTDDSGEPLDDKYDVSDIAEPTREQMEKDCREFLHRCANPGKHNLENSHPSFERDLFPSSRSMMEEVGFNFWLTRNHHGAGFQDGDWEDGDVLTRIAHSFSEYNLYVGDDGKIHGS